MICHTCHQTVVDDICNMPATITAMGFVYRRDTWTTVRIPLDSGPTGLPAGDDLVLYEIDWKPQFNDSIVIELPQVRALTRATLFCEHLMRPSVLALIARARWMPWPA